MFEMRKVLLFIVLMIPVWASAQVKTLSHSVYFGNALVDWNSYEEHFVNFCSFLKSDSVSVNSIKIEGYSSPTGFYSFNNDLSERRARTVARFMRGLFPFVPMTNTGKGEDWNSILFSIENSSLSMDERVLLRNRIVSSPEVVTLADGIKISGRKKQLMNFDNGKYYDFLKAELFPKLRRTDITVEYVVKERGGVVVQDEIVVLQAPGEKPVELSEQDRTDSISSPSGSLSFMISDSGTWKEAGKVLFALRSNLLVPLCNIGVVLPLGRHLSVGADWYSPWFWHDLANRRCFEFQAAAAEIRWWINPKVVDGFVGNTFSGHSLAAGVLGGHYDFERNWKGTQGEVYGGFVDYTYSKFLSKKFRLEFSLSLGYLHNDWRKYRVFTEGGKLIRPRPVKEKSSNWFGPVKAAVSFVLPIETTRKVREGLCND